jgi:hypothetical protein
MPSMCEVLKPVTYDTVGGAHSSQSKSAGNVLDKGIKEIKKAQTAPSCMERAYVCALQGQSRMLRGDGEHC